MSDARPAYLGGTPVRPQGPPDWPFPDDEVRQALEAAYRDGGWGRYDGGRVRQLEASLAAFHGVEHVATCGSGTFAVELALRALKVGPGDEVILAAYDYPGNFLSVHAIGATPVLIDLLPGHWTLDPAKIEAAVSPSTRAIIVSHLHGTLAPMPRVMEVARALGVPVVEDAAQGPGATISGRRAASWGDVGILSFGGSKLLTAGRGGALLTARPDVYQRARVALLRGNLVCPLSELQAAVLLPQVQKLDEHNAIRSARVSQMAKLLADVPGLLPAPAPAAGDRAGYYKMGLWFDAARFGLARSRFAAAVRAEGIALHEGFAALHMSRSPSRFRSIGQLDEAERAHRETLILHHPILLGSETDVADVARAIQKVHAFGSELGLS